MDRAELIELPLDYLHNHGDQLELLIGDVETEFGWARSAWLEDRLLFLGFYEGEEISGWKSFVKALAKARLCSINERAVKLYKDLGQQANPAVWVFGTAFQRTVWQAVSEVPKGRTVSYKDLAVAINKPRAVRAVGSALGANKIAYLIPCHRAIRGDGSPGGYRWGLPLKTKILSEEATDR